MQNQKKFNEKYRTTSHRLKNYDYSSNGAYFITICTKNRQHFFGEILEGKMILNDRGNAVQKCWKDIPKHFPFALLDAFVIMPNHIHGILCIKEKNSSKLLQKPKVSHGTSQTVGSIIRGFKIGVTKYCRQNTDVFQVWQANYYDHIIRDENE